MLGVEIKLPQSIGYTITDLYDQVKKYSTDLNEATYLINGEVAPHPSLYLVVTPESFYEGHLYKWSPPNNLPKPIDHKQSGWVAITEVYDRLLQKHNAAILREKYFISNKWGPSGEKKWERRFELWS